MLKFAVGSKKNVLEYLKVTQVHQLINFLLFFYKWHDRF